MINNIDHLQNLILDEEKEILFIQKISHKKMELFLHRIEKDLKNAHQYSLSKMIIHIISDVDNLEKAIHLSELEKNFSSIYIELKNVLNMFLKLFKKYHITMIQDNNIPFNPNIHQAIAVSASKKIKPNYIIQVVQKGYKLYERVIRPAMVVVAQ